MRISPPQTGAQKFYIGFARSVRNNILLFVDTVSRAGLDVTLGSPRRLCSLPRQDPRWSLATVTREGKTS